mmetsp:Transcript_90916/g.294205  ORF Transcript_90916/g.294205 Transcript_90916/m.294205 type:complete len:292 (-) Transcript_90916:327-1202(-)
MAAACLCPRAPLTLAAVPVRATPRPAAAAPRVPAPPSRWLAAGHPSSAAWQPRATRTASTSWRAVSSCHRSRTGAVDASQVTRARQWPPQGRCRPWATRSCATSGRRATGSARSSWTTTARFGSSRPGQSSRRPRRTSWSSCAALTRGRTSCPTSSAAAMRASWAPTSAPSVASRSSQSMASRSGGRKLRVGSSGTTLMAWTTTMMIGRLSFVLRWTTSCAPHLAAISRRRPLPSSGTTGRWPTRPRATRRPAAPQSGSRCSGTARTSARSGSPTGTRSWRCLTARSGRGL